MFSYFLRNQLKHLQTNTVKLLQKSVFFLIIFLLASCRSQNNFSVWNSAQEFLKPKSFIVAGVSKSELEIYLKENRLKARVISEKLNVYEVEKHASAELKEKFPEARLLENQIINWRETQNEGRVSLEPEEAYEIWKKQMQPLQILEAQQQSLGEGVVVAVIDSGVDINRWDLKENIWINSKEIADNQLDDDQNGYVDDLNGWNFGDQSTYLLDTSPHGTMSAGIIASRLTGIAPEAKIMVLKVTDELGSSSFVRLIEAYVYAIENGADIINISMAPFDFTYETALFIQEIGLHENKLITNSAGNFGISCEKSKYAQEITKIPNLLLVGALDLDPAFKMAKYSVFGECLDLAALAGAGYAEPDLTKQGIITSYPNSNHEFATYHGTSAAAPVVAGVAALVKAKYKHMSGSQLAEHLKTHSTHQSHLNKKIKNGLVINALNAVTNEPIRPSL